MAKVTDDILEGSNGVKDYLGWIELERIMIVSEISLAVTGWVAKVNEAISAAGLVIGNQHPDISYLCLRRIQPEGMANDTIKLTCLYTKYSILSPFNKRRANNSVRVGASLIQETTDRDKDGGKLYVSYIYPATYYKPDYQSKADSIVVNATVLRPQVRWNKFKIETASPENKAADYVGSVNLSTWRGKPARTWMCTEIMGESFDEEETFEVQYEFQYNPNTWDDVISYIREDGKTPEDLIDDVGRKVKRIKPEMNFNNLNLT